MEQLPVDADVRYYPDFLTPDESVAMFDAVVDGLEMSTAVPMADGTVFNIATPRCVLTDDGDADLGGVQATYGPRHPFPLCFAAARHHIADVSGRTHDVCMCILYPDGHADADFHADLPSYGDTSSIASLSLGAVRTFALRRRDRPDERLEIDLADGSLLLMGEHCQQRYEHALLPDPGCALPRLNLTFRVLGR